MEYKVSCYNGGPIFGFDWMLIRPDEVIVSIEARSESEAIFEAKLLVKRDYYKIVEMR